jgi:hypothetical protein
VRVANQKRTTVEKLTRTYSRTEHKIFARIARHNQTRIQPKAQPNENPFFASNKTSASKTTFLLLFEWSLFSFLAASARIIPLGATRDSNLFL